MSKLSVIRFTKYIKKNLQVSTCIFIALIIIIIVQFFTFGGLYNYPHIPIEEIPNELYKKTVPYLLKNKPECSYDDVLSSAVHREPWEVPRTHDDFSPKDIANGTFVPNCTPQFSVAIIVTYRNRQNQLDIFIPYMHNFLRKQNIHYRIYLVEQQDEKPWNKGVLYNIGAKVALADGFPCLVLHDVDLLPLDEGNAYVCGRRPRHLSAAIDKFRYVLPYAGLVGGALALRADQFVAADGFSNRFERWGGEDDDMFERLRAAGLTVVRFPRSMSRYTMLVHRQEPRNEARRRLMAENRAAGGGGEGYHDVTYRTMEIHQHRLYKLIGVKL